MLRVLVGLSGGVDSSVTALLLLEQGHDVIGVTLRLGIAELHGRRCCGEEAAIEARRVASALGIPHITVDVASRFAAEVVGPFAEAYARGRTPNPCVVCNERVKFAALIERADVLGCHEVATGHYARVVAGPAGRPCIARGTDATKDQSYFLYRINPMTLSRVRFPLGGLTKSEVRRIAAQAGLSVADREESQEVCFADDHVSLVARLRPEAVRPGAIETSDGRVVGTHAGVARYTVGQRKGIGIGGPGGPWRVVAVDAARNAVVVGPSDSLLARRFVLSDTVWRSESAIVRCAAVLRYRARPAACEAHHDGERIVVELDRPCETTAPGQSVVLYQDDVVIGGGVMERWER